jgi:fungal type III polyketide synthase
MSPSRDTQNALGNRFGDLNLSIIGLGTEYPPYQLDPACLNTLVSRHYPKSPAYVPKKTLRAKTSLTLSTAWTRSL